MKEQSIYAYKYPNFSRYVEKLTKNLTPQPPSLRGNGENQSLSPCREQRVAEVPSVVATAEREVWREVLQKP